MKESHKSDFEKMVKANNLKVYNRLLDVKPGAENDLAVGQMVDVINGCGCIVGPFEILGFCEPNEWGRCVYLDWDCYWFTKNPNDIITK